MIEPKAILLLLALTFFVVMIENDLGADLPGVRRYACRSPAVPQLDESRVVTRVDRNVAHVSYTAWCERAFQPEDRTMEAGSFSSRAP